MGDSVNIICTQPRRVAATSVAERVAEEMNDRYVTFVDDMGTVTEEGDAIPQYLLTEFFLHTINIISKDWETR